MKKLDKIKMAIWMFNELIEKYPEVYMCLKKQYIRKNSEKVNIINSTD